ncbi:MAG: hypothetical protein M3Z09_12780 [Acidobacteriota bacterium]|nr:hypothetical protein [Acidobacteriota bacterium]
MRVALVLLVLILPVASSLMLGQRRRAQQPTASAGAYSLPAVTFHGVLKEMTGKEIVMEAEDGQTVTLFRNRKTRFLKGKNEIPAKEIQPGARLTVDVSKNPDASLLAVNVMVDQK